MTDADVGVGGDGAAGHYDARYFDWQSSIGAFGGIANLPKFEDYVQPTDRVIDFGCGGGYLLANLEAAAKLGIEPNATAREEAAARFGLDCVAGTAEVEDGWADVIISNHALEHTRHPLRELERLRPKLRPGGRIVFVVPCEHIGHRYRPGDVNHHLYSWSPMAAGNLFTEAGYEVQASEPFIHKWPPRYRRIMRWFGPRIFHLVCRVYARVERSWFQVRVVAVRPPEGP